MSGWRRSSRKPKAVAGRPASRLRLQSGSPDSTKNLRRQLKTGDGDRSYRIALGSLSLSIVVAVVTPGTSYLIAKMNNTSTAEQTAKTARQTQERTAAADFFTAANDLVSTELYEGLPVNSGPRRDQAAPPDTGGGGDVASRTKVLIEKADSLDAKFTQICLAGTPETVQAAKKIHDFLAGQSQTDAVQLIASVTTNNPGWQKQYSAFMREIQDHLHFFDEFLNAVRKDLGIEQL